jgi:hypothetical protein
MISLGEAVIVMVTIRDDPLAVGAVGHIAAAREQIATAAVQCPIPDRTVQIV